MAINTCGNYYICLEYKVNIFVFVVDDEQQLQTTDYLAKVQSNVILFLLPQQRGEERGEEKLLMPEKDHLTERMHS